MKTFSTRRLTLGEPQAADFRPLKPRLEALSFFLSVKLEVSFAYLAPSSAHAQGLCTDASDDLFIPLNKNKWSPQDPLFTVTYKYETLHFDRLIAFKSLFSVFRQVEGRSVGFGTIVPSSTQFGKLYVKHKLLPQYFVSYPSLFQIWPYVCWIFDFFKRCPWNDIPMKNKRSYTFTEWRSYSCLSWKFIVLEVERDTSTHQNFI